MVSVGITLASVGITVKDIWFNARNLNGLLGQLGVSAKVTVLRNTGEWDSPIVGIPQCFNRNVGDITNLDYWNRKRYLRLDLCWD